jgi:TolB-like protein/class 3 adenylate cyclase
MVSERVQRRLAAILAADVVGYSHLMEVDEAGTLARLKALRSSVFDPAVARNSGRVVKLMGDGALIEFASTVDAVTCALDIQKQVPESQPDVPDDQRIQFRIGINVGDVIVDGDDLYGDGINVASRIEALAEPGGIWISRSAADHVRDKIPIGIESRGSQTVKNIARPIEVYCLVAGGRAGLPQHPPAPGKTSIAVLAFNNMSGDSDQEYFSDGISEDIITDLAKLSELHVIARNSSFVYKQSPAPLREVARQLGVRYVLEGSVRKAGNRVRVTAQLIDATTDGHIWAERFDRDLSDIFAVQDELTREIVAALKVKLTTSEQERLGGRRSGDLDAYNHFLQGREQRWLHTPAGNAKCRALMAKVIEIEPNHAAAHAISAFCHVNDYANGWTADDQQSLLAGAHLARRAVELDDQETESHFAMGVVLAWSRELEKAFDCATRAIALSPSTTDARQLRARTQIFMGDPAGAVETLDIYMKLNPLYPEIALHFLADAYLSLRQFDLALSAIERRLQRNPRSATAHALLASIYGHLGRIEEGKAAWAKVPALDPDYSLERQRRILPFRNPEDFELRVDGLRRLGVVA